MRLVADTNVVVSALLWGGTPGALFALAETVPLEFYTSKALLAELEDVLSRKKLAKTIQSINATAGSLLQTYAGFARVVQPRAVERAVAADADDDQVVACAVAARARLIVSGDRHLLTLGQHKGIRISSPAQAVRLIGGA